MATAVARPGGGGGGGGNGKSRPALLMGLAVLAIFLFLVAQSAAVGSHRPRPRRGVVHADGVSTDEEAPRPSKTTKESDGAAVPGQDKPQHPSAAFLQQALLAHFAAREAARPVRRACFVSLVRHTPEGLKRFARLLKNVKEMLPLMAERYPFVAFLEHTADVAQVQGMLEDAAGVPRGKKVGGTYPLKAVFPGGVILANLDEGDFGQVPSFVKPPHLWAYPSHAYWGISYRHMCRFFGVRIMAQPALAPFDYYLRLDTDSFLLSTPKTTRLVPTSPMRWDPDGTLLARWGFFNLSSSSSEAAASSVRGGTGNRRRRRVLQHLQLREVEEELDLFREMAARGSLYGFQMVHPQPSAEFLVGLWPAYDGFARQEADNHHLPPGDPGLPFRRAGDGDQAGGHGAPTPFRSPRGLGLHFWDNFEIVDLRWFRTMPSKSEGFAPSGVQISPVAAPDFANELPPSAVRAPAFPPASGAELPHHATREFHGTRAASTVRFLSYMDHTGGFYDHRWGDAELRTLTATLYLDQSEMLYFDSFGYQHYHNYHCPLPSSAGRIAPFRGDPFPGSASPDRVGSKAPLSESEAEAAFDVAVQLFGASLGDVRRDPGTAVRRHDAVDALLRQWGRLRVSLDGEAQAACEEEAHKNYGRGNKGPGGAAMHPAEHASNNKFFWAQRWPSV